MTYTIKGRVCRVDNPTACQDLSYSGYSYDECLNMGKSWNRQYKGWSQNIGMPVEDIKEETNINESPIVGGAVGAVVGVLPNERFIPLTTSSDSTPKKGFPIAAVLVAAAIGLFLIKKR